MNKKEIKSTKLSKKLTTDDALMSIIQSTTISNDHNL